MALRDGDAEKAFLVYCDNEAVGPLQAQALPAQDPKFAWKRALGWTWKGALTLTMLIVVLLGISHVVQPVSPAFCRQHQSKAASFLSNLRGYRSPIGTARTALIHDDQDDISQFSTGEDSSLANSRPGASLAATRDHEGNLQLWDLASDSTLRLRKQSVNSTKWSDLEIVPTNPPPKANSSLAALAWNGTKTGSNLRIYYLDTSNRIVEVASTSCTMDKACSWFRNTHFTATSTGGITAVWMGSYDGIRLFYPSGGVVMSQQWFQGSWRTFNTNLPVKPNSDLSAYYAADDAGTVNWTNIVRVDPSGACKEISWDRKQKNPGNFVEDRIIDPTFIAHHGDIVHFSTAYGAPDGPVRMYWLEAGYGPIELSANTGQNFTQGSIPPFLLASPDVSHDAVASLAWGSPDSEVRIFYVAGGALHEGGMTSVGGTSRWWDGQTIA